MRRLWLVCPDTTWIAMTWHEANVPKSETIYNTDVPRLYSDTMTSLLVTNSTYMLSKHRNKSTTRLAERLAVEKSHCWMSNPKSNTNSNSNPQYSKPMSSCHVSSVYRSAVPITDLNVTGLSSIRAIAVSGHMSLTVLLSVYIIYFQQNKWW